MMIDQLRTLLGDDLEEIQKTRLNRLDELEALVALHQEFGEEVARGVIKTALRGRRRHKVSAIEVLEAWRREKRELLASLEEWARTRPVRQGEDA
jgi:hypothetical protein